jgi:hypothetical protein
METENRQVNKNNPLSGWTGKGAVGVFTLLMFGGGWLLGSGSANARIKREVKPPRIITVPAKPIPVTDSREYREKTERVKELLYQLENIHAQTGTIRRDFDDLKNEIDHLGNRDRNPDDFDQIQEEDRQPVPDIDSKVRNLDTSIRDLESVVAEQ